MNWHCAPVVKHLVFEAKVWGSNPPRPRPFGIYLETRQGTYKRYSKHIAVQNIFTLHFFLQIHKTGIPIRASSITCSQSNNSFQWFMLTWEKQTKTYSHMKLWDNITPQILNRFQWLKAHNDQDKEIYALHTMILEKRGFEILLIFEAEGNTVLFWSSWPETDAPKVFQWWMMIDVWLEMAWWGCKQVLPWLSAWRRQ